MGMGGRDPVGVLSERAGARRGRGHWSWTSRWSISWPRARTKQPVLRKDINVLSKFWASWKPKTNVVLPHSVVEPPARVVPGGAAGQCRVFGAGYGQTGCPRVRGLRG